MQFFDKDEKHLITTILAIPNERVRPTGKSVFAFWEVPAGQPKALRAWFYPGDNFGQEFAYPKLEAERISASNNNTAVPIKDDDLCQRSKTETVAVTPAVEPAPASEPAPCSSTSWNRGGATGTGAGSDVTSGPGDSSPARCGRSR